MTKLISLTAALVLGITFTSFAGDNNKPKEEPKNKIEATPTPSETKAKETTFYAIRIEGTDEFRWTDNLAETSGLVCAPLEGASCSVLAEEKPENNQNPESPDDMAYQQP